jgi:hypothetical protein
VLFRRNLHAHNFPSFAFGGHFERPAANFAIRRKSLPGETRVNHHFAVLAAIRALNVGKFFHAANLLTPAQSANRLLRNPRGAHEAWVVSPWAKTLNLGSAGGDAKASPPFIFRKLAEMSGHFCA